MSPSFSEQIEFENADSLIVQYKDFAIIWTGNQRRLLFFVKSLNGSEGMEISWDVMTTVYNRHDNQEIFMKEHGAPRNLLILRIILW